MEKSDDDEFGVDMEWKEGFSQTLCKVVKA